MSSTFNIVLRSSLRSARAVGTLRVIGGSPLHRPSFIRSVATSSTDDMTNREAQSPPALVHGRNQQFKETQTDLTTPDAVSTVPKKIEGDWVLFHPVYSQEEMASVKVLHRSAKTSTDKIAYSLVKISKWGYDLVTGYKHKEIPPNSTMSIEELRKGGYIMNEAGWLNRILFLETIAGVPGMVAATLRHLVSLRLMRRDSGWIHTCLEEAENERMHLMTFMSLRKSSLFFRLMIMGAQGVFYNLFFLVYMISPKSAHRFVGYLEEEAVNTYTLCLKDLERGLIPEWSNKPAPRIAIDYWRLDPKATMHDVILAVRSDESTHRFVNHSFANLDSKTDVNPFAIREPTMFVRGTKVEFKREESEKYVQESRDLMAKALEDHSSTKSVSK